MAESEKLAPGPAPVGLVPVILSAGEWVISPEQMERLRRG